MNGLGFGRASLAGLVVSILAFPGPARAAGADPCAPAAAPARVAAVLDDLDLALDDGRELRLAGIDPARATAGNPGLGEAARGALSAWLSGRAVTVASLAQGSDRWDRVPALVWAGQEEGLPPGASAAPGGGLPPGASVGEAVLGAGWGRFRPEPGLPVCFPTFRAVEGRARTSGLGLWSDPYYAILDADDGAGLARRTGAMAIVEGRLRLGVGRARAWLRLGRGSGGFAATLSRRGAKTLAKAGLDPAALSGRRIRIRGFLDDRFGPRIDVVSPDQIEPVDEPAGHETR